MFDEEGYDGADHKRPCKCAQCYKQDLALAQEELKQARIKLNLALRNLKKVKTRDPANRKL